MRSYAQTSGRIGRFSHLKAYDLANKVVLFAPDGLSCHEVADELEAELVEMGLTRERGHCGDVGHSWFVFPDGVVLDPYRPGCHPQVLLIDPIVAHEYRADKAVV